MKTERRHTPRMTVKGLAYVNLDHDNGGIIMNVCEGGLCFQSRAPVQVVDVIRFWFSYRYQRTEAAAGQAWTDEPHGRGVSRFIEVGSELAWIDETRRTGGLRFTNLPEAARQQIRDWMRDPGLAHVNERPVLPLSSAGKSSGGVAGAGATRLEGFFRQIQTARIWRGFSGGLLSGLLLSGVLIGLFSSPINKHKLGDSLVHLGELLGGRSWSQPLSAPLPANSQESISISRKPQPVSVEPNSRSAEPRAQAGPIQATPPETLPSSVSLAAAKSSEVRFRAPGHDVPSVSRASARPLLPRSVVEPAAEPDAGMLLAPVPEVKLASQLGVHTEPAKVGGSVEGAEKYLEVGKFKEKTLAEKQIGRLSQLDFPAKVVQSSRFLGKSYQVLVGPYGGDSEAEAVHKDLSSYGFTARSYERGKRDFSLRPGLKVGATHLPTGNCVISWESYIPDAIVKIEDSRGVSVTLEGKWLKKSVRYDEGAIVYKKDRDGSLTLLEIRFSGLTEALVFLPRN